jgi:hypothetical protein
MMRRARSRGDNSIQEGRTWSILVQMLLGLHYLHSRRVLHRDMKTANVFLTAHDGRLRVKIGDLGVAKLLGTGQAFADTMVGTPYYLSPELVQDKPYNGQSDLWALGIILYECCTLKRPFEATNQCALILKIVRGTYAAVPPENASSALIEITNRLLELDPRQRPSARKLLSLPVVQQQLLGLGFELPSDIRPADTPSEGLRTPHGRDDDSAGRERASPLLGAGSGSTMVSSRLESLARPRPAAEAAPQPPPLLGSGQSHGMSHGVKQQLRGGRVRGAGQRQVSQRAQKKPELAVARATAARKADAAAAESDDENDQATAPASAPWQAPERNSRPTVADLFAKQHEGHADDSERAVDASESGAVRCAVGESKSSDAASPRSPLLEAKNSCYEAPRTCGSGVPPPSAAPVGGGGSGAKLQVLGWAAEARARREADFQTTAPAAEIIEEDEEEAYEEDWVNDSDGDGGESDAAAEGPAERRGRHEESFSALARSTRAQCAEAVGNEAFESLFSEMAGILAATPGDGDADDAVLHAFFEKATLACGNDRYRAQHVIFGIQKILAAEAGLREAHDERALAADADSKAEVAHSASSRATSEYNSEYI